MTEHVEFHNTVAPLRNVALLVSMIDRVQNRGFGMPGMATYYGPSGFGKTTAATYAANQFDAVQIEMNDAWTRKTLCTGILEELGIEPAKTLADMVAQIARELAVNERPLLIDEADHLCKFNMIELVRGIHESSAATIVLIGEEKLPQKLQKWERVHGRMYDCVGALPACLEDVTHLAKIWCPGIDLEPDFKALLLEKSAHSIRRVCTNLERVREAAMVDGVTQMTAATWGKRPFFSTVVPRPRDFA